MIIGKVKDYKDTEMIKIPEMIYEEAKVWCKELKKHCKKFNGKAGYCTECKKMFKIKFCRQSSIDLKFPDEWDKEDIEMMLQDKILRDLKIRRLK